MERTQIYLDADLRERLRVVAEQEGRSMASVLRDAAAEYLSSRKGDVAQDPLLELIGIGSSSAEDGALYHDHYLYGAPRESE